MNLDFSSFAFGYRLSTGGGTPNWATSFGQGREYKIRDDIEGVCELLKGLVYKSVSPEKIFTTIGKGGRQHCTGADENSPIVIGSVFDKVFFNGDCISGAKFILLVVRDDSSSHCGRLKLKYGPQNGYKEGSNTYTNNDFLSAFRDQFRLDGSACWFVSKIDVLNQDELHLVGKIVQPNGEKVYSSRGDQEMDWSQHDGTMGGSEEEYNDGENLILYGVPGCGKSYAIETEYCHDDEYMERVVFHPDYTYTDFIGQVLPCCEDGNIQYRFVPGPFTRILKKATRDSHNKYFIVIEEINRGNAPAIFGDIFQLLDRDKGKSVYGVSNAYVASEVYGNPDALVRIPGNLTILATMNTSDQNVFTLDNAFKRRWRMRSVASNMNKCVFATDRICGTDVTWASFVQTINSLIISTAKESIGSEDKRIGAYFVKKTDLPSKRFFAEKVLMYLWNDVFKFNREDVFKSEYSTLEALLEGFMSNGFSVFADTIKFC